MPWVFDVKDAAGNVRPFPARPPDPKKTAEEIEGEMLSLSQRGIAFPGAVEFKLRRVEEPLSREELVHVAESVEPAGQ